jgi:hypothetical protein
VTIKCTRCEGTGWVCEIHILRPWEGLTPVAAAPPARPVADAMTRRMAKRRGCRMASGPRSTRTAGGTDCDDRCVRHLNRKRPGVTIGSDQLDRYGRAHAMSEKPKPDLETHERELRNTRQEVRNLQVMQMRPGQTAEQLKHLADLERSARAEVKLRVKALAYARSQIDRTGSKQTDS